MDQKTQAKADVIKMVVRPAASAKLRLDLEQRLARMQLLAA
jgi:hypothetical protein